MEALIPQFTFLSGQALQDKTFDPFATEDIMKLFELDAYKAWAAMELEQEDEEEEEVKQSEKYMTMTATATKEDYLDSSMEDTMDEFRQFEEETSAIADSEYTNLIELGEKVRKMGKSASLAFKRYVLCNITVTKEDYLDSAMEDAMDEFRRFEDEMNAIADSEYTSLIELGEKVRKMGKSLEKSASLASKRYIEATMNSATASMRSAMKALSSKGKKVHPS